MFTGWEIVKLANSLPHTGLGEKVNYLFSGQTITNDFFGDTQCNVSFVYFGYPQDSTADSQKNSASSDTSAQKAEER